MNCACFAFERDGTCDHLAREEWAAALRRIAAAAGPVGTQREPSRAYKARAESVGEKVFAWKAGTDMTPVTAAIAELERDAMLEIARARREQKAVRR